MNLQILITPTALTFKGLTDSQYSELSKLYKLENEQDGDYSIHGTREELFNVILNLSFNHDIEIV